jgi:hypothetical protein
VCTGGVAVEWDCVVGGSSEPWVEEGYDIDAETSRDSDGIAKMFVRWGLLSCQVVYLRVGSVYFVQLGAGRE